MPDIDKDAVLERLGSIRGPDDDRDIVRRGMVSDVVIANGPGDVFDHRAGRARRRLSSRCGRQRRPRSRRCPA